MTLLGVLRPALALVVALAACSRSQRPSATPTQAHRVVSLSPATTEALFAIGAGDRVVGRSRFCNWPPEAEKLPVLGGVIDADLEAILQIAPDLVVGQEGPSGSRLAAQLGARGIATWFPEAESFAAVDAMIVGLGARTAHCAQAARVVNLIHEQTQAVERAVASEPAPRVLVVVGTTPVVAAGPGSFLGEMTRRARATNVLGTGGAWQTLGFEQVIELDPDVVVDTTVAMDPGKSSAVTVRSPGWADLRAVREGHVVSIDDDRVLRPGPRIAQGLAVLARALHPSAVVPGL